MNNLIQTIKTLTLATILSLGISFAYAWTEPTSAPTGGNTSAPLNTSGIEQVKPGNIGVNAMKIFNEGEGIASALQVLGGATFAKSVGIGTTPSFSIGRGLHITGIGGTPDAVIRLSETNSGLGNFELRSAARGTSGNRLEIGEGSDTFLTIRSDDYSGATTSRGSVGIATTSPSQKLSVAGTGYFTGGVRFGDGTTQTTAATAGTNYWTLLGTNIYNNNTGNVGIGTGTTAPGAKLHVAGGNIYSDGDLYIGTAGTQKSIWLDGGYGTRITAGINRAPIQFYVNVAERVRFDANGNVGIGTTNPGAKLEVAGQMKITGGTPGVNKVLTSDATGLASWTTPASAPVTSVFGRTGAVTAVSGDYSVSQVTGAAPTASPTFTGSVTMPGTGVWNSSGNVGIGTTNPSAKLQVSNGNILIDNPSGMSGLSLNAGTTDYLTFLRNGAAISGISSFNWLGKNRMEFNVYGGGYNFSTDLTNSRLWISDTGNVGIGVTDPKAKLDVAGMLKLQMYTSTSLTVCSGTTRGTLALQSYSPNILNNTDRLYLCGYYIINGSGGYQWKNVGSL